ncbi:LexA family transcriptional regulator [Ruminococcus sp. CLA-AA-H200]|uniref:LexA family transcriptional regulator n=2 Tax=Ruminococcus turbiniformis TaxID=2881258 RepID=A0ABS8FX44_9FIRM|nr:LexA family transcriptional regulator [Ruminococcus turbiniformis]
MTRKQDILSFIGKYMDKHGYAPSIEEIGEGCGLKSKSTVHNYLKQMFADGTLETESPGCPRAFRISSVAEKKTLSEQSELPN